MGPADLQAMMSGLAEERGGPFCGRSVLVGTETGDDAGVYALDENQAIVVTADFITPVADDPYRYGQIAAANSISDVFAMGGRPLTAVALCLFPKELDAGAARDILAGGHDKTVEAGAVLLGGHTVRNPELLYGLSVTGVVHPERILRNVGARVGDVLVLTKPLGTGLLINGRRKGLGSDEEMAAALASMARLNKAAAEAAAAVGAHAATDVTGFGLVGHALKMAAGSSLTFHLDASSLAVLPGVRAMVDAGVTTGSTKPNRAAGAGKVRLPDGASKYLDEVVHDPQTSGGLLIAVEARRADELLARLGDAGVPSVRRIGEARPAGDHALVFSGDLAP